MSVLLPSGEAETSGGFLTEVHHVDQVAGAEHKAGLGSVGAADRYFRQSIFSRLERANWGQLHIRDPDGLHVIGEPRAAIVGAIRVNDPRMYRMIGLGGSLAAAEAFIRGYWDSDDLVSVMRILARHAESIRALEQGSPRLLRPLRALANCWKRNSRAGSRRNIAAHYDLSNAFFGLMLDATMTYSSGYFEHPEADLEQASVAKYERLCAKLKLAPNDHVLEIGCGWGGFAVHAASRYGCQVTATTISTQQFEFAQQRVQQLGLTDRVRVIQTDYRDLDGQFDKIVSIEMIEAVGEAYLDLYFAKCSRLLKSDGVMALQAITIPDYRYEHYRRSVDFIRHYVFPGGFLPSLSAISSALRRRTDLRVEFLEDFPCHYAHTLSLWRKNFLNNLQLVRELGFDERFIRTWTYYLNYCEAGFRERQIGVSQLVLAKPAYRG